MHTHTYTHIAKVGIYVVVVVVPLFFYRTRCNFNKKIGTKEVQRISILVSVRLGYGFDLLKHIAEHIETHTHAHTPHTYVHIYGFC